VIVQRAAALLGAVDGCVFLVDSERRRLVMRAGVGIFSDRVGRTVRLSEGLGGRVVETGEPVVVADYAAWDGQVAGVQQPALRTVVGVPLTAGGAVCGVLAVSLREPDRTFGAEEIAVLGQFARLASVALDSARLFEDARSAEQSLRRQLDFTRAITNNLGEGVLALNAEGEVTLANPAAERLLGWPAHGLSGRPVAELIAAPGAAAEIAEGHPLSAALSAGVAAQVDDAVLRRKDGTTLPVGFSASPISSDGHTAGAAIAFHDISDRKAQTEALQYQAQHDALTGLPNRVLLHERLEEAILFAAREDQRLALLVMDLDGFKEVNDTLGHLTGDVLLQAVAVRLERALRSSDTVARLGGDEFAILLPGVDAAGAQVAAQKLLDALDQPILIDGYGIDVGASVGIATFPAHGEDAQTLLRRADVAMYVAKRGKSGAMVYTPEQDQHSPDRLALLSEMRTAIESGHLTLDFQPIVRAVSGRAPHVEALVRWQHPRRGVIQPDEFIPLAEQTGLINPLTRWVLATALRLCASWRAEGRDLGVAVNLSARTLHDRGLPEALSGLLAQHALDPAALTLEITESALVPFPQRSLDVLTRLHTMGVRLVIDDFGTGYSSLAYLKRLPVDEIKLDKSFVIDMLSDPNDAAIVRATIDLAHNLGLRITAEGVESAAIWAALRAMGCDAGQGYFLGRPTPTPA